MAAAAGRELWSRHCLLSFFPPFGLPASLCRLEQVSEHGSGHVWRKHMSSLSLPESESDSLTKSAQHCYVTTFAFPFPSSFPFPVVSFYFSLFLLLILLLVILPPSTSLAWPSLHKKNFCPSLTVSLVFSFSMQIKGHAGGGGG